MPKGQYDRAAARKRETVPHVEQPHQASAAAYRIVTAHGFVEDAHGKGIFYWQAGEIITRPATIALLLERGADMEPVECPAL